MKLRIYSFGRYRPRAGTRGLAVRIDQAAGRPRRHLGWDLLAPVGTPVYAVANGWITWRGNAHGYGLLLQFKFEHLGKLYYALYCHLSNATHKLGWTKEGTVLAHTGISGWESDARRYPKEHHLHFEIRDTASLAPPQMGTLYGTVDPGKVLGYYFYPYGRDIHTGRPRPELWKDLTGLFSGKTIRPTRASEDYGGELLKSENQR
jgi:murein DD-endopeptidase MepM/ murein hydrolase activator NlpD